MNYLAFDFGDGTTSAAVCNGAGEPVVQNILAGEDEIPSVLNYCKGGDGRNRAVIGANAVSVGDTEAGLRMNWKSRPTQMEQTADYPGKAKIADTKIFMKEVYRAYVQQNGALENDTRIVIGTPSAWTAEDRDIYKTYAANQTTGMRDVLVLSESQAAYLFAQKFLRDGNGHTLSSKVIQNGLLIIDVGSSTTDFTFARGMSSKHYGIALGAKYVDENLYKWGLSQSDADERLLALLESPDNREVKLRLVFKCRERKEEYFRLCCPGEHTQRVPERVEELLGDDEVSFRLGDLEKGRTMSEALFDRLLDAGCEECYKIHVRDSQSGKTESTSWREHFRSALQHVAKTIIGEGVDKVSVVLTGGASRMYFVDDDIRKVLGAKVPIFAGRDKDRSFSVVKGLAWAGYAVAKIDAAASHLSKDLDGCRSKIRASVRSSIVNSVFTDVRAELAEKFAFWIRNRGTRSGIRKECQDCARRVIENHLASAAMREKIGKTFVSVRQSESVTSISRGLYGEFGRMDIPFEPPSFHFDIVHVNIGGMGSLDLNSVWDDLFAPLLAVSRVVGGAINTICIACGGKKQFETDPEKEYLDSTKRNELADDVEKSWQAGFWEGVENQISWELDRKADYVSGARVFCDMITDAFLSRLKQEKKAELEALKGVFS